jgi:hypothetical protein
VILDYEWLAVIKAQRVVDDRKEMEVGRKERN